MKISQSKLIIKQEVEMLEALTGFETKNKYSIRDASGKQILYAYEESGAVLRQNPNRRLKLHIVDKNKKEQLLIERPFFFFIPKHTIKTPDGRIIGFIKQKFTAFKTVFKIYDSSDRLIFSVIATPLHIWTYRIYSEGREVGKILKKWGSLVKEMYSDADSFMVDFGTISDETQKKLILACAFAIDLRKFEGNVKPGVSGGGLT